MNMLLFDYNISIYYSLEVVGQDKVAGAHILVHMRWRGGR